MSRVRQKNGATIKPTQQHAAHKGSLLGTRCEEPTTQEESVTDCAARTLSLPTKAMAAIIVDLFCLRDVRTACSSCLAHTDRR